MTEEKTTLNNLKEAMASSGAAEVEAAGTEAGEAEVAEAGEAEGARMRSPAYGSNPAAARSTSTAATGKSISRAPSYA